MADPKHMEMLKRGREAWNQWRARHLEIRPDLVTANLYRGSLNGSDLSQADLTATNLRDSSMCAVNLHGAMLVYATLMGSDLRSANFAQAKLIRADMRWANLKGAVFGGADLRGSDLGGADLRDADLSGALGLTLRQVLRGFINANTRLPSYLFQSAWQRREAYRHSIEKSKRRWPEHGFAPRR